MRSALVGKVEGQRPAPNRDPREGIPVDVRSSNPRRQPPADRNLTLAFSGGRGNTRRSRDPNTSHGEPLKTNGHCSHSAVPAVCCSLDSSSFWFLSCSSPLVHIIWAWITSRRAEIRALSWEVDADKLLSGPSSLLACDEGAHTRPTACMR